MSPPRWLGIHREFRAACGSTNDVAQALARVGAPSGTVVYAAAQTAGRGRAGRAWASPDGAGLYVSMIVRLALVPRDIPPITLAVGIAACDVARALGAPCVLKWPNDLVVRRPDGMRKLGGILTETTTEGGRLDAVVIGIGMNLGFGAAPPAELTGVATSIADELGRAGQPAIAPDREAVLDRLCAELEPWLERYVAGGVPAIAPAWTERADRAGRVRATIGGATVLGRPDGLDADGALRVIDDTGRVHRILAGDVVEATPELNLVPAPASVTVSP
ncbi:MAG: biotin--[acetyl-CoA-carboxylase] ligase [Deltaproteobacteria bacterium]|nr:biotin--[acetyl-CoA-carboxylase] ligase [Deltaproteobacteria bacterium]